MCHPNFLQLQLDTFERELFEVSKTFYQLDGESGDALASSRSKVRELRKTLRFSLDPEARRAVMSRIWILLRKLKKAAATKQIQALKKYSGAELTVPTSFKIEGNWSYNREEWLRRARMFGSQRFYDPGNCKDRQIQRLRELDQICLNLQLDGGQSPRLEFWDVIQARSQLKSGGAAGGDGNTTDVYRMLPFAIVAHVYQLLSAYSNVTLAIPESPFWKILKFIGFSKDKAASGFGDLRWMDFFQ